MPSCCSGVQVDMWRGFSPFGSTQRSFVCCWSSVNGLLHGLRAVPISVKVFLDLVAMVEIGA